MNAIHAGLTRQMREARPFIPLAVCAVRSGRSSAIAFASHSAVADDKKKASGLSVRARIYSMQIKQSKNAPCHVRSI